MLRACLWLLLACWTAGAVRASDEVVDWHDAARCVGRDCGLLGTVVEAEDSGPTIRLYFDADRIVRVILMRGWMVDWPPYVGRTIIANGEVHRFRDHYEMILLDPSSIVVFGGEPGATPTPPPAVPATTVLPATAAAADTVPPTAVPPTAAPPPGPPTSIPAEVEELRQRVRELEQRIEQLEGR